MQKNDIIKSIEWQITSRCNYRCEYCFQSKQKTSDCSDEVREKVLELTDSLDGSWFVKLIGGEPFICRHFFDICSTLVDQGHTLALTTNFSADREKLGKLLEVAGDKLTNITASLHLSQVKDISEFIEKCVWFEGVKGSSVSFAVTSVLTPDNFEQLKQIEGRLKEGGVEFRYQRLKTDGIYAVYDDHIEQYVKDKFISNLQNTFEMNSFGLKCYTGIYFFRIMLNGDVVRCYNGQPAYKLGNMVKGTFRPFTSPVPCMSKVCTCTTPANRNMIKWDEKSSLPVTLMKNFPAVLSQRLRRIFHG